MSRREMFFSLVAMMMTGIIAGVSIACAVMLPGEVGVEHYPDFWNATCR